MGAVLIIVGIVVWYTYTTRLKRIKQRSDSMAPIDGAGGSSFFVLLIIIGLIGSGIYMLATD